MSASCSSQQLALQAPGNGGACPAARAGLCDLPGPRLARMAGPPPPCDRAAGGAPQGGGRCPRSCPRSAIRSSPGCPHVAARHASTRLLRGHGLPLHRAAGFDGRRHCLGLGGVLGLGGALGGARHELPPPRGRRRLAGFDGGPLPGPSDWRHCGRRSPGPRRREQGRQLGAPPCRLFAMLQPVGGRQEEGGAEC